MRFFSILPNSGQFELKSSTKIAPGNSSLNRITTTSKSMNPIMAIVLGIVVLVALVVILGGGELMN